MDSYRIWIRHCKTARRIEDESGTRKALKFLLEEKFISFLQAAEHDPNFRAEIPAFVTEIKNIFEPWQLQECLETARQTEPFIGSCMANARGRYVFSRKSGSRWSPSAHWLCKAQ